MYRINELQRPTLITTDEVIFHAPTSHTLDPRMIQQSIIIAEERFIRNIIGFEFYEAMLLQKNVLVTGANLSTLQNAINLSLGTDDILLTEGQMINASEFLSAANLVLWKMHLWKLCAECVALVATSEAFVQFTSEGVVHKQPQSSPLVTGGLVTPSLSSVKWTIDKKIMDRIDPLQQALHTWICKNNPVNNIVYPYYLKPCDCDVNGVPYKRKTDIILGLYDEEPNCGCDSYNNNHSPYYRRP